MESIFLKRYPFFDPPEENWHLSLSSKKLTKNFLILLKSRKKFEKVYISVKKFNKKCKNLNFFPVFGIKLFIITPVSPGS